MPTVSPVRTQAGIACDHREEVSLHEPAARIPRETEGEREQVILVRWGHEMELANLYPWGDRPADVYQQAFRHVVEVFRAAGASNVRFVWSPAGNANAVDYYPGEDVVDYVGVTVLGDAAARSRPSACGAGRALRSAFTVNDSPTSTHWPDRSTLSSTSPVVDSRQGS